MKKPSYEARYWFSVRPFVRHVVLCLYGFSFFVKLVFQNSDVKTFNGELNKDGLRKFVFFKQKSSCVSETIRWFLWITSHSYQIDPYQFRWRWLTFKDGTWGPPHVSADLRMYASTGRSKAIEFHILTNVAVGRVSFIQSRGLGPITPKCWRNPTYVHNVWPRMTKVIHMGRVCF